VIFSCPNVRQLKPVQFTDEGRIKRIRGIAYCTRVSPQTANRIVESARSVLNRYIPDVYIYTDVYKGAESGKYVYGTGHVHCVAEIDHPPL
jgi:RNA 3'-terminal phosphate cyclase-like protein